MPNFPQLLAPLLLSLAALPVNAHPGEVHHAHEIKRDLEVRDHYAVRNARLLNACSDNAQVEALRKRTIERRTATAARLRKERDIKHNGEIHTSARALVFDIVANAYTLCRTFTVPPRSRRAPRVRSR